MAAIFWLRERLPAPWEIEPTRRVEFQGAPHEGMDAAVDFKGPSGSCATIAIQAEATFGPRDLDRLLGPVGRTLRRLGAEVPILVVSGWLSERTQELLREQHINYIDLTGNALVRLDYPTLYLETQGASKNPNPPSAAQLGSKDLRPPVSSESSLTSSRPTASVTLPVPLL